MLHQFGVFVFLRDYLNLTEWREGWWTHHWWTAFLRTFLFNPYVQIDVWLSIHWTTQGKWMQRLAGACLKQAGAHRYPSSFASVWSSLPNPDLPDIRISQVYLTQRWVWYKGNKIQLKWFRDETSKSGKAGDGVLESTPSPQEKCSAWGASCLSISCPRWGSCKPREREYTCNSSLDYE